MNDENQDQLRQSLLELHYDLLEDAVAQSLRDAIENDPEVAAEWDRTLRLADQFSDAARIGRFELPASSFPLPTGDDLGSQSDDVGESNVASPAKRTSDQSDMAVHQQRWSWATSASIATVAAMLGMLLIGSWYLARLPERPTAVIRLQARQVPGHLATADHEFRFFTSRIDRSTSAGRFPVTPATLSFAVLTQEATLFSGMIRTDEEGTGSITLPDELVIPPDARLQVTAESLLGSAMSSSIEVPLAPTRCLSYLSVDRPVYRPGETVFFRSLTLRRRSLQASSDLPIRFELLDPDGEIVADAALEGITDRGVGNGAFSIPSDALAGVYTLVAKSLDGLFPTERCQLQVHSYRVPQFRQELRFGRRSYSPGETVDASLSVSRVTGEPLAAAAVAIEAFVDGKLIGRSKSTTSSSGACEIAFPLPASILAAQGELRVTVQKGEDRETKLVKIPIQIGQISVDFYPEGGYLVEGLENRMYFAAHDALGRPIHLEGEIVDEAGKRLARVETRHDGMGRVSLRPIGDHQYRLKVTRPNDVGDQPRLPSAVQDLPVIDTGTGVYEVEQPLKMIIRSSQARSILIQATCRGQLVGRQRVRLNASANAIVLPVSEQAAGVVRVTVLDASVKPARPLVERLVYRRPAQRLQIEVLDNAAHLRRSPGQTMDLTLQVRDESGKPTSAVLGVSVVDEAVESLGGGERPSLSTHFVLMSEVETPEDLEQADFYLSNVQGADQSLDLLLGTQGWRRFITPSATASETGIREQLIRLLDLDGPPALSSQRFDNANLHASQWFQYHAAVQSAGERLRVEVKVLAFVILFVWFLVFLLHRRRRVATKLTLWCLIIASSWLIQGCGARPAGVEVASPASDSALYATESDVNDLDRSDAEAEQHASSDSTPNGVSIDPTAGAENEVPAEYVDWLDEAKAAWLLRVSAQDRSDWASEPSDHQQPITKADLLKLMEARGLDAEGLADDLLGELRFPIRQYAHQRSDQTESPPHDYSETLYWQPLLATDAEGRAAIHFDLSDSITTFRIRIDGHSVDGRIGTGIGTIITEPPQ